MEKIYEESEELEQAIEILESAQGKIQTPQQRQKAAVELAALMLKEANRIQSPQDRKKQKELARMMHDLKGKAFTTSMTDQCFRSSHSKRIATQLTYLLKCFGVPRYLSFAKKFQLKFFQKFGKFFYFVLIPIAKWMLRKEASTVILPGEEKELSSHMKKRRAEGVRINLNHLGEAILGEYEALKRLNTYLSDLTRKDIEYISIKISTIFSQINLISWDYTIDQIAARLRQLYRVAKAHTFTHRDGSITPKFVNLDMEEYRDLRLTADVFKKVLSEKEFHDFSAGIVLQAYLPDAHEIQKEMTEWAIERVKNKGAPLKIRIVKGANLAMEQVEASLRSWQQAPYQTKLEVDANYKRMITYACFPENAKAVHLGVASHNLFDIAYALLLRVEYRVEKEVSFEMLEGMADHIRKVVQKLSKDILLYCPVATKEEFQSAIAYLIRRLDENTGLENFLRYTFDLKPNSPHWNMQAELFIQACEHIRTPSLTPRRTQNRNVTPSPSTHFFENEADTDFSLLHNRLWLKQIAEKWGKNTYTHIPSIINGKEILPHSLHEDVGKGFDPSDLSKPLYTYTLCDTTHIDEALKTAKSQEPSFQKTSIEKRMEILFACGQIIREKRGDLIGVALADGGKSPLESDPEISEAIDFADYYAHSLKNNMLHKDVEFKPRGTILVAPPWNFPISIPAGGILAALATGNCVLFKPAPEAVLSGWILVNLFWQAGVPKEILQFITCSDDHVGSHLIKDPRLNGIILTGATSTAKLFLKLHPGIELFAECGGKNSLIITDLADRDLAIKDLIQSAFGHSGQKCSAASLAILEAPIYDDPLFLSHLKDATESLKVGSAWNFSSKIVPLIHAPNPSLLKALTSLEEGESWLVKPKCHPHHPNLWSPGIKIGIKEGSFMHQTELFGPVLGIMRAKNLEHAIHLANETPYGLTSGLHSLDEREHQKWIKQIEAGNLYINRTITGAIVLRQPFGGCKASHFGPGAKAGGPNYLSQFTHIQQSSLPEETASLSPLVENFSHFVEKLNLSSEELQLWKSSLSSYAFWSKKYRHEEDSTKILGQDNLFFYKNYSGIVFRLSKNIAPLDILRVCAAALSCGTVLQISWTKGETSFSMEEPWKRLLPLFKVIQESEAHFLERVKLGVFTRIRLLSKPSDSLKIIAAEGASHLAYAPVLASGRFELLHYLREVALSKDYHRYGNLGVREGDVRKKTSVQIDHP